MIQTFYIMSKSIHLRKLNQTMNCVMTIVQQFLLIRKRWKQIVYNIFKCRLYSAIS